MVHPKDVTRWGWRLREDNSKASKEPRTFQNRVGKKKKKSELPKNLPQRGSVNKSVTMVVKQNND